MNRAVSVVSLCCAICLSPANAQAEEISSAERSVCYSSYQLDQVLDVSLNVGLSIKDQRITMSALLHVRELPLSKSMHKLMSTRHGGVAVRAFLFQIDAEQVTVDGTGQETGGRYAHPFIIYTKSETGAVLELVTTQSDSAVIKEYQSFIDIFQYSAEQGEYRYSDGTRAYDATIIRDRKNPEWIEKINRGYVDSPTTDQQPVEIIRDVSRIKLSTTRVDCFFKQATSARELETVLSDISMVEVQSHLDVVLSPAHALVRSNAFFGLDHDTSLWPDYGERVLITAEQAMARIPHLFESLSGLLGDDAQFLAALQAEDALWPFFMDYINANTLTDALSKQLFWALGRANNQASVRVLTELSVAGLDPSHRFRAIMALGSTSAPMDSQSVELLKRYSLSAAAGQNPAVTDLTLVRMMGAMADRRALNDAAVSGELKNFLYTQAGTSSESMNAAVIAAIGNLGESIDAQGSALLIEGVGDSSSLIRQTAASALSRIPYDEGNSDALVRNLRDEQNVQVSKTLIGTLSKTTPDDNIVKSELVSLVSHAQLSASAVNTLDKVEFALDAEEIRHLEARLKVEPNPDNARVLAKLILRYR